MIPISSRLGSVFRPGFRTRTEIVAYQTQRLRLLVQHCYNFVPYYRRLFDENSLTPDLIRTIEDLQRIPASSKKDLQLAGVSARTSAAIRGIGLIERRTSGSTGEEFTIRRTRPEEWILNSIRRDAWRYYGVRSSDQIAYITIARPDTPKEPSWQRNLKKWLQFYRRKDIDGFLSPADIAAQLEKLQPDFIAALPSVLSQTASYILSEGRHRIRPRIVSAGGEVLTPLMRNQIETAFGVPVHSTYGTQETNLIAWQCKAGESYHIAEDSVIVEIENQGKKAGVGDSGEVIVTGLHSFAMPFLRYRIADLATRGPEHPQCSCGLLFSTLHNIQGRMIDMFRLPGGRLLHPWNFIFPTVRKFLWIRQYQLLQEKEDLITFHIVPYANPSSSDLENVTKLGTQVFGNEVNFRTRIVSEIPYEKTGKFRVCRSLIQSQYE
jgi:phenylacetate-CoA ligase